MSKGASGGFFGSPDDYPQSSFKHEVLRQYLHPFTGMTGSQDRAGRVTIVDGYAGAGRYDSGDPASAELIMRVAQGFIHRTVQAFFVESNRARFGRLEAVVNEYREKGVTARARRGDIADHLDEVIGWSAEIPMFLFLDPCGAVVPFDALAGLMSGSRRAQRPATEVLLNFSAGFSRRTIGALAKGQHDHDGIPRLTTTCGGDWWQEVALAAHGARTADTFEAASEAVVAQYAKRLAHAARARHVVVPVRKRQHHQPVFHLVFLTRAAYGEWVFSHSVGMARRCWLRGLGPQSEDQDDGLFPVAELANRAIERAIRQEESDAQRQIEDNVRRVVATAPSTALVHNARQVLGQAYGIANDRVVANAVRNLARLGQVVIREPVPARVRDWVVERPPPRTVGAPPPVVTPDQRPASHPRSGPLASGPRSSRSDHPTA